MKKSLLFLFALASSAILVAAPVDPQRAKALAKSLVPVSASSQHGAKAQLQGDIVYTHHMPKSGRPAIYVVNVGNAFVLVSADDVAHPVLGYNYMSFWPTDGNLPPQVKAFLDDLAAQMEAALEHPQDAEIAAEWQQPNHAPRRQVANNLPDSVGPLLTTAWNQGQYYNSMCPEDVNGEDGHCPTGCVATAMAQIIKYWGDKQEIHTRGIHSYDSNYGNLRVNYDSTTYDFAHMPTQLTEQSTQQEINAVAKLIYECGVAVNMQYETNESGSSGLLPRVALVNHFMFNSNTTYFCRRGYKNTDWEEILREQLAAQKPVIYNSIDTIAYMGHSFVCDGYKQGGFFHFNFGWSGNGDGWFLLSSVNPGIYSFDNGQAAIVNISPSEDNSILYDHLSGKSSYTIQSPVTIYNSLSNSAYRGIIDDWYPGGDTLVFYPLSKDAEVELTINNLPVTSSWITNIYVYDGANADSLIRVISSYDNNGLVQRDSTPIVSSKGALCVFVNGIANYDGYSFDVYEYNGCSRVTGITSTINNDEVIITWQENSSADTWEIEYGLAGFSRGTGTLLTVNENPTTIIGLEHLKLYDVYIRSVCGSGLFGRWSNKFSFMSGSEYWVDQVEAQPSGYIVDATGDIRISSAEGLVWFAMQVDYNNNFHEKTIHLLSDVDMSGYIWTPIEYFRGHFEGHGHTISNLYMQCAGMFNNIYNACEINDVHLRDLYLDSECADVCGAGGLVGVHVGSGAENRLLIRNCSSTGVVQGRKSSFMGGLIGSMYTGDIINCWSSCRIIGMNNYSSGGICGNAYKDSHVKNCYFRGSATAKSAIGGVTGWTEYCDVEKSYAYYDNFDGWVSVAYGGLGTTYKDLEWFTREDTTLQLFTPIAFEDDTTNILIDALNNGVIDLNDSHLRTWVIDPYTEMPCFGDFYDVTCPNITNLTAHNIVKGDNEIGVALSWQENGLSTQWEINYQEILTEDDESENSNIDKNVVACINNPDTIWGLKMTRNYEFKVRSICDSKKHSGWSEAINIIVDKPYWTEIVTSQPEGYITGSDGNITISSAEGLAWLISVINGLNGEFGSNLYGKRIILTQDVNMGQYKWLPINGFSGTFDGGSHSIRNLYVNELTEYGGFFGKQSYGARFQNINIDSVNVTCKQYAGGIIGAANNASFKNCHVSGNVYGEINVGGISGKGQSCRVDYCSFTGIIHAKHFYAGGLFGDFSGQSIRNSYAIGDVMINGYGAGGIVGPCYSGIIENCYSIGYVSGFMHNGGLIGCLRSPSAIHNCYVSNSVFASGLITNEGAMSGIIIGVTDADPLISHCYGQEHDAAMSLIGPAEYTYEHGYPIISDTASYRVEGDEIKLLTSVYVEEVPYIDLLSALNAWVDANNSDGIYRHWVADTANINGGFPIFAPTYTITFLNDDGSVLQDEVIEEGVMPIYRGVTPAKAPTAEFNYTFIGWDKTISAVTGDETYTAQFAAERRSYLITFVDEDGTLLASDNVKYGSMPVAPATPTKEATAQYTYTFAGWDSELVAVTGEATYTATYSSTINRYMVTFYDEDSLTVLCSEEYEYGAMPECDEPSKSTDEQYTYAFAGWSPEVAEVTGEAAYKATYIAELIPTALQHTTSAPQPVKVIEDEKLFIILPDGSKYSAIGVKVE